MEILKRAKGNSGETIPWNIPEKDLKDEINSRTYKAGYTDRDGQPRRSRKTSNGKGDVPRPCNKELYNRNYERIFGKK